MQWGSALVATRPAPAPLGRPVRARLLGAVAPRIAPVTHAQKLARVCRARGRRLCPDSASHPPVPRVCSSLCLSCRGFRVSAPLPDLLSRHRPVALRLAEGVPFARHHVFRSRETSPSHQASLPDQTRSDLCLPLL